MQQQPTQRAIELIKKFEEFSAKSYKCPAGVWTVGYGHTETAKEGIEISKQQAENLLNYDIQWVVSELNKLELHIYQVQFDALVSLVYNIGIGNFKKSTLLRLIRENPSNPKIETEFLRWVYIGKIRSKGLENRRREEVTLYFSHQMK